MDKKKSEMPTSNPAQDVDFYFMKWTVFVVTLTALIGIIGITIASFFAGSRTGPPAGIVACILLGGLLWLTWKNHLFFPRIVGPLISFLSGLYMATANYGIRDRNMFCFFVTIVLAGLFLGRVGIIIFGGMTILAISSMAYVEIHGILPTPFSAYTTPTDAIIINVFIALSCATYYVAINNLTRNVHRLQRSETALAENNRELENIRLRLEEQVVERTRNLESARQEIETANQALQSQMWQVSGLAQLGDVMRGDQDLATLARNVIRQLCQYLDAPLGALYGLESGRLTLIGSYAYVHRKHLANEFALGQGIVGQAAREQQMITLSNVPDDYVALRTASGNISLRHILAIPFLFNDEVIGVIELGGLSEFTPSQLHFLEEAMSNIAIAFHTTQSRARIDALLAKTQEQHLVSQAAMRGDHVEKD